MGNMSDFYRRFKSVYPCAGKSWQSDNGGENPGEFGLKFEKENSTFAILIKFADALKIEMWKMFDFGHEVNIKELREIMSRLLKETDEEKLGWL